MTDLEIKRSNVSNDQMGGEARSLLTAALMECLSSTVYYLFKYHKVRFDEIKATGDARTAKGDDGRVYVSDINMTITPQGVSDPESIAALKRIQKLLDRGCLISRSLKKGIHVSSRIQLPTVTQQ